VVALGLIGCPKVGPGDRGGKGPDVEADDHLPARVMQPPSPNIFSVHWTTDAVVGHPQRPREGRHGPEPGHAKYGLATGPM